MRSVVSLGAVAVLAVTLSGCPQSGGGGGGVSAVAVTTTAANFAVAGNLYTSTLAATGGTPPYTWSVISGLPLWASLNPSTGVISGTPTTADVGNSNPTFRVTDATGGNGVGTVLLAVHPRTDIASVDNSTNPVPGNAASGRPAISNNGRYVAFASSASNLIPGVSGAQIYLHDRQTNQTSLVSRNNSGNPADPAATTTSPSISSDGRFITFVSNATNLVSGVTGLQIYLRDTQSGVTSLVSKNDSGIPASGGAVIASPSISGTGRFIAYVADATNLVAGGVTGQQIYAYDTQTTIALPNGQTVLISRNNGVPSLPGNGASSVPSISDDACYVAFASLSTNLGAAGGNQQIYTRGPLPAPAVCPGAEQTSLVSQDKSLVPVAGDGLSDTPSTNANGGFVAFSSLSTNLVSPSPGNQQIYVRAAP